MAHFAVLVVGDNVEEQMAPYDEELEVDPYIEEGGDDDYTSIIKALCWDNDPDNTRKTGFTRESTPQEILEIDRNYLYWLHTKAENLHEELKEQIGKLLVSIP